MILVSFWLTSLCVIGSRFNHFTRSDSMCSFYRWVTFHYIHTHTHTHTHMHTHTHTHTHIYTPQPLYSFTSRWTYRALKAHSESRAGEERRVEQRLKCSESWLSIGFHPLLVLCPLGWITTAHTEPPGGLASTQQASVALGWIKQGGSWFHPQVT